MTELTNKFSISELQSILIFLQGGCSIADLIREIENPESTLFNPSSKGKFKNMLCIDWHCGIYCPASY